MGWPICRGRNGTRDTSRCAAVRNGKRAARLRFRPTATGWCSTDSAARNQPLLLGRRRSSLHWLVVCHVPRVLNAASASDWCLWEAEYNRTRGQPPIHPRFVAGAILYGMYRGIRSTRRLEEACCYRLDFQWLVEGRRIDHTTFNKFRTKFKRPLKDLFRQIGRVAMGLGLITLCEVAFGGTRVKANNSRYKTRTAKTLEEKLERLDELFEQILQEQNAADAKELGFGRPTQLPASLAEKWSNGGPRSRKPWIRREPRTSYGGSKG